MKIKTLYESLIEKGLSPIENLTPYYKADCLEEAHNLALFHNEPVRINFCNKEYFFIPTFNNDIKLKDLTLIPDLQLKTKDFINSREYRIKDGEINDILSRDSFINLLLSGSYITIINQKHWECDGKIFKSTHLLAAIAEMLFDKNIVLDELKYVS